MKKHYHFIGIGGIGMGTLASLLLSKGLKVSGSDIKENELTAQLKKQGATIAIGHNTENIQEAECVVYSSAIRMNNPEMIEAVSRGLPVLKRAEVLAELLNTQTGITIGGAHGKTTTTSMISSLLINANLHPTTAVGGLINGSSYNANLGAGKYFVAEVDESDGTFLYFSPFFSIITNIDFEHVDYYKNWDNIIAAYRKFINRTNKSGFVIGCGDDERLKSLLREEKTRFVLYGFNKTNDIYADNVVHDGLYSRFDAYDRGGKIGTFELSVPGRHNVLNALASIALAQKLGIDVQVIERTLKEFKGVKRRFQIKGEFDNILVVDDYGHHPTELVATLNAAKQFRKNRVVTAFQPHRYSRTKFLLDEFVASLNTTDYLIVTDVYAASEKPSEGVTVDTLYTKLRAVMGDRVVYLKKEKIIDHLLTIARPGDLILTLGAGDIYQIGEQFIKEYANHALPQKVEV